MPDVVRSTCETYKIYANITSTKSRKEMRYMRATNVIERLLTLRGNTPLIDVANKCGFKYPSILSGLKDKEDVKVSTLYKVAKYFGYVVIVMNPADDTGNSDMVITQEDEPLPFEVTTSMDKRPGGRPRQAFRKGKRVKNAVFKDPYTGQLKKRK